MNIDSILETRKHPRHIPSKPSRRDALHQKLPYGMWECAGGYSVLFNRRYWPMLVKAPDGRVFSISADCWIKFEKQTWFYNDGNSPADNEKTLKTVKEILAEWTNSLVRN